MKAIQINSYGTNDVLKINENAPKPSPKNGQVLVEIFAASINPFDLKIRAGYLKDMMPLKFPTTLGGDFVGVVVEVDGVASDFNVGDKVYGSALIFNGGSGSFAEFCAANIANIALKPESVDFAQASALPLVGSSTVQALEEHIKLQGGQKILIHGGAGGIGHIAIQLAKSIGAFVATTVSTSDIGFVKQLGADQVIDYKSQNFEDILKDFDAVYDTVGGSVTEKSFSVLKKGGTLVSMLGLPNKELATKYGITPIGQNTQTNSKHLKRVAELVDSGKIKVNVDKIFSLEMIKEAANYQEAHPRGKVVLKIKDYYHND